MRILVADDHDIIRRGLRQLLTSHEGWQVCGEAKTGREAIALAEKLQPEVVVLDITMPEMNGLEAARRLHKQFPKMGILILTMHFSEQLVREVVAAGARGYILKSDADSDLPSAIEALANHQTFFTSSAAEMLLNGFAVRNPGTDLKVLLSISVKTVEAHRANVMRKLEMHSVSEVVRYAVKNHIIEI
jgi:DNA-binding NarL/FixJ family response regulator